MATKAEMIQGVKDYATEHYEDGGWDVIVECYDDEMIADLLKPAPEIGDGRIGTVGAAIKRVKHRVIGVYADRQADARNSAF